MWVYSINFENGKRYIGVSSDVNRRVLQHKSSPYPVGAAMRKHDWTVEILFEGSQEACFSKEVELIAQLGTIAPGGYNVCQGGEGIVNPSPKVREAVSDGLKRAFQDPETKARCLDPAWKAKQSARAKALWTSPGFREKEVQADVGSAQDPLG